MFWGSHGITWCSNFNNNKFSLSRSDLHLVSCWFNKAIVITLMIVNQSTSFKCRIITLLIISILFILIYNISKVVSILWFWGTVCKYLYSGWWLFEFWKWNWFCFLEKHSFCELSLISILIKCKSNFFAVSKVTLLY